MVKTFLTAVVCGTVFSAHLFAQEVFVGEQHAKPKYPKAEPAVAAATVAVHSAKAKKNSPQKKVAVATPAKPVKEKKPATLTTQKAGLTKATPSVKPGQTASKATPPPVVKP